MKFRNAFEQNLFNSARRVCGNCVSIEHNRNVKIEDATSAEVASFVGPPQKEIDVITAGFETSQDLKILISAKDYKSRAEPADVQEWGAVLRTMNKYSAGTTYLGLVVSRSGFTAGCEPWAGSENLGLVPPLKGKKLEFEPETVVQMFERVIRALERRLHFPHHDLFVPPQFYDFVYQLTEAFEGRDDSAKRYGDRYRITGTGYLSSFGELVRMFQGKTLQNILVTSVGIHLGFSDGLALRMIGRRLEFGSDETTLEGSPAAIRCEKNFFPVVCSFEFLRDLVIGQNVTSAGDWGDRLELGLTDDLMLAIEPDRLQVYRTRNPVDENLL